jgi:ubiquinone/menaquinone biosynthesis C-methylase UbiE
MTNNNPSSHFVACPYWLVGLLDNPVRRWIHKPEVILAGLVQKGHTALDLGCGPGYFTLGIARMVGERGRVIALDLQEQMLDIVRRKAGRAGLLSRIQLRQSTPDDIGVIEPVDFGLAFWMLHEVRDQDRFLQQLHGLLKPGGRFLLVEPVMHVSAESFQASVAKAHAAGLESIAERKVRLSQAIVFQKQ